MKPEFSGGSQRCTFGTSGEKVPFINASILHDWVVIKSIFLMLLNVLTINKNRGTNE